MKIKHSAPSTALVTFQGLDSHLRSMAIILDNTARTHFPNYTKFFWIRRLIERAVTLGLGFSCRCSCVFHKYSPFKMKSTSKRRELAQCIIHSFSRSGTYTIVSSSTVNISLKFPCEVLHQGPPWSPSGRYCVFSCPLRLMWKIGDVA